MNITKRHSIKIGWEDEVLNIFIGLTTSKILKLPPQIFLCYLVENVPSFLCVCPFHLKNSNCLKSVYFNLQLLSGISGEGNGTPLQYSCLENPMVGGAWWAAVHGVAEGWTQLSDFTFTFHFHALEKEIAAHSSVLAWRIPGTGEPGVLLSMGSHRVGHDWSNLAAVEFLPLNLIN